MKTHENKISKKLNKKVALSLFILFIIGGLGHAIAQTTSDSATKRIKIALLLDTSNSMDGLIEQAKSQLWLLINELAKAECEGEAPTLEIALYEYGNDRLSAAEGYIRQVTSLTSDLDQISEDLFKLTTNGGSEYCGMVIQTAINQQEWSSEKNDLQIIFIAGNEEFTQGNVDYRKACGLAAKNNIIVNTIFCGRFDEGIRINWKDGAMITGGEYMCIEQDRKTVYIPSPYDDKISQLNKELNNTYLGYGTKGHSKMAAQMMQDSNAAKYGKSNEVQRAISKSSHFYKNKTWDLVDAIEDDEFELDKVKDDQLPDVLKGKSVKEKQGIIAENAKKRSAIRKQINELNQKRMKYVAEQKKSSVDENTLDKVMIKSLKEQAVKKNLKFK